MNSVGSGLSFEEPHHEWNMSFGTPRYWSAGVFGSGDGGRGGGDRGRTVRLEPGAGEFTAVASLRGLTPKA